MEPPAYAPPEATQPYHQSRSITDLRAQIIANASVIRPKNEVHKSSADHVELIVALTPVTKAAPAVQSHMKAIHSQAGLNAPTDLTTASSSSATQGKHYAVLIQRGSGMSINIIKQGEPRDTVEEALEWMLAYTEKILHNSVVQHGRPAKDTCAMM